MPDLPIGYCTNVHAGVNLTQTRANLEKYAFSVRKKIHPDSTMGVGLWLSANSAREMLQDGIQKEWQNWLGSHCLVPYTLNGFPHGDFHQQVVKHKVYLPTWYEDERKRYTSDLIQILHALLPEGMTGTISTLPIGWGTPRPTEVYLIQAGKNLALIAEELRQLESSTGRHLMIAIEPEPGCVVQESKGLVSYFNDFILPQGKESVLRRYLGVCHDVCHATVMFEDQKEVINHYHDSGITIAKVQISSAIGIDFDAISAQEGQIALQQLAQFNEPRYLHQTSIRDSIGSPVKYFEDLAPAMSQGKCQGQWWTHFHVPIYLEKIGMLTTSQKAILECRATLNSLGLYPDYEVETYAWSVLPKEMEQPDLPTGIAREIAWWQDIRD